MYIIIKNASVGEMIVWSMDFQMQMSNAKFKNENSFALAFAKAFISSFRANQKK